MTLRLRFVCFPSAGKRVQSVHKQLTKCTRQGSEISDLSRMAFDYALLKEDVKEQYLEEDGNRPWIVAFSGGKDSTMLLQIVWYALQELPRELLTRPIYVICNNTLV